MSLTPLGMFSPTFLQYWDVGKHPPLGNEESTIQKDPWLPGEDITDQG